MVAKKAAQKRRFCRVLCFMLGIMLNFGLTNQVQGAGTEALNNLELINATGAYARGYTGKGITLGICDLYVKLAHPAFAGKNGSYTLVPVPDNFNWQVYEHGTRVASIMVASKNNATMQGVAFDANLVSGSWFDPAIYENTGAFVKTVQGTYGTFNTLNNVKVINNSWAITGPGSLYMEWIGAGKADILQFYQVQSINASIFENSVQNYDKVLVFAAGNSGHTSPHPFALLPYTAPRTAGNIMVAIMVDPNKFDKSTDTAGTDFLGLFSDLPKYVEENSIAAPGWNITSAIAQGDTYGPLSGTSFAAPHVTAVAGLVQQAFPYMTGKQIVDTVLSTANKAFTPPTHTMTLQSDWPAGSSAPKIKFNLFYFGSKPDSVIIRNDLTQYFNTHTALLENALWKGITLSEFLDTTKFKQAVYENVPREMIFGQGLLDAEAAVRGPGLLNARRMDSTGFSPASAYKKDQALYTVNTQGYNSVWSNNIGEKRAEFLADHADSQYADLQAIYRYYKQGDVLNSITSGQKYIDTYNAKVAANGLRGLPVGLLKTGSGTLALTGANTYQGSSIAAGGVLQIDGSVAGDAFSVETGTIAGSGTIGSHLYNRSIIQAGSYANPGTLTVTGNLESYGQIAVAANRSGYGKIAVTGPAIVDGTGFKAVTGSIYRPDFTYQGVLTAGSIIGNFTATAFTGMLSANGSHDGNSADLTLQRANNLINLSSRQLQSYDWIQSMYTHLQGMDQQRELDPLYSLNPTLTAQALTEIYGGAQLNQASLVQQNRSMNKSIAARMESVQQSENRKVAVPLPGFASGALPDKISIPLELDASNSWWMNLNKSWGSSSADPELPSLNTQNFAVCIGRDQKISGHWRAGLALEYTNNQLTSSLAKTASNGGRLGTYAGYQRGAFEVQTQLVFGKQQNNATRYLRQLGLRAESKYDSNTISLGATMRYALQHTKEKIWQVKPYADINVTWYNQDSYQENGAGVYNQKADSLVNTYSTAELGIQLSRKMAKGRLGITLGYKRVLSGSNPEMTVVFSGNPNNKVNLRGNEQDREYAVIGMIYQKFLTNDWTIHAQVDMEKGRHSNNMTTSLMLQRKW